ncbi:MAG: hypothetical protein L6R35_003486 [Caloplaca aegaea]|nr:MAG: hypothetical protein L6R35_003486 [Caloplaca aegaea]
MSTIASPRQSTTSISPDRSRRSSLDTLTRAQATSPARLPRRNKTALRDYYNLKATVPADASNGQQRVEPDSLPEVQQSELDAPGFDAEAYVAEVLGRESLQGLLKIESGLINEIRGLDGEKKALVYDNYSKLITATDTIRKMRTNMDPLIPTTSTLAPAISHIAETATSLAESLQERSSQGLGPEEQEDEVKLKKQRQRDTVRWVLAAPRRLRALVEGGRRSEAVEDWQEVRRLVEKWKGVDGAEEVKEQCLEIMGTDTSSNAG